MATDTTLKSILLVEDEQDIRVIAKMALEKVGGFTVEMRNSGSDAVARAGEFTPDLILLDVMMPEMDGPTTLARLREVPALAGVPVVFMTAKVQQHEVEHYLGLGAVGVIAKPFAPMELPGRVRELYAQALAPHPA